MVSASGGDVVLTPQINEITVGLIASGVLDEYHVRLGQARDEASQDVPRGRDQLSEQQSQLSSPRQPDIARLSREPAGRILGRRIGGDEYGETVDAYLGRQRV